MRLSRLLLYQIYMHAPASRGQLHSSTQVRIHQKVWFFWLRLSFSSSFALLTLLTFAFPEGAGEQGKLAAPSREDIIWYLIKLGDAGNLARLFQHVPTRFNRFLTSACSPMWPLYTHYLVLRLSRWWFDSETYLLSRLPGRYSLRHYVIKNELYCLLHLFKAIMLHHPPWQVTHLCLWARAQALPPSLAQEAAAHPEQRPSLNRNTWANGRTIALEKTSHLKNMQLKFEQNRKLIVKLKLVVFVVHCFCMCFTFYCNISALYSGRLQILQGTFLDFYFNMFVALSSHVSCMCLRFLKVFFKLC